MDATSDQKSPAKRPHAERDRPNGVNHEECESPPNLEDPPTALSNYVIVKNIFKFHSPDDLESCSYVSNLWREFSNPLIVHCYNVEIQVGGIRGLSNPVVILTRDRTNFQRQKNAVLSFEDAMKTLEKISRNQKVALNLMLQFAVRLGDNDDLLEKFIFTFGHLVVHLGFLGKGILRRTQSVLPSVLFKFLPSLPNLKSINYDSLVFLEFYGIKMDLPSTNHEKLKKISFGVRPVSSSETLVKFLKVVPNLEEIHKLPIELTDAVEMAKKGQILESVSYDCREGSLAYEMPLLLESAFETLARLQPKLSSFFFPGTSSLEQRFLPIIEMIKPSVCSILQSSANTLRTFEIGTWDGLQIVPQLKGVKTLVFQACLVQGKSYSTDITLCEKFPNVNAISIHFDLEACTIEGYLPKNIESAWRSQIKRLHVLELSSCSLPLLRETFPLVEDLKFSSSVNQLEEHLPEMARLWPQLKSMTIHVDKCWSIIDPFALAPLRGNLDCSFTGLPLDLVLNPSRRKSFNDTQIETFKSESPISKLKELQRLTLRLDNSIITNNERDESLDIFTTLTEVSNEYGFKLLPNLKVSVGIWEIGKHFEEIKRALEPLARSSNVEILYCDPNQNAEE